jgi:NADPH2:quinone reductase
MKLTNRGAYFINEKESIPGVWKDLLDLFESGKLKSAIYDKVYTLETIPQGLNAIANRETFAKVVARVGGSDSKL